MGHQIGIDPTDHTGVHVCHLEEGWNIGVPSSTVDKHDIAHPPVTVLFNDHGHPCLDVQEQWVAVRPDRDPLFLHVKAGMTVIVEENGDWWMGDVVFVDGGARNTNVPTLFQVANVDTGVIRWINADLVTHIVPRIHEPVAA